MKYLLIDFGASYIKCAVYDKNCNNYKKGETISSPFLVSDSISKKDLLECLDTIVELHERVDGIVMCTVLGGSYVNDTYVSWKSSQNNTKNKCLMSGLLNCLPHIHHKEFTDSKEYLTNLKVVGHIKNVPLYSVLGDTNCAHKSISLSENSVIINIGTGSQVISKNTVERYFPAGRMLLVYQRFFQSIGVDMFKLFKTIRVEDVVNSTMEFNLNVFKQSRNYASGGSILNINEETFSIHNFLGSLLKSFVIQYKPFVKKFEHIILVGGITKKISILPELFKFYYPDSKIHATENEIESTHKGLIEFINEEL